MKMTDNFFEEYDFSLWIFAVGITVIMLLIISTGVIAPLLLLSLQSIVGEFSNQTFGILLLSIELVIALPLIIANLLVIRGKANAVIVNKASIFFNLVSYLFIAMVLEHEYKWFFMMLISLPVLARVLMQTQKYAAYVAYFEALHRNPQEFREALFRRSS
ncbi:hypothetical protein FLM48_17155 [Shewanella sp. Scap07]|uniref:hypothetical protein n=1 Tax=Shewanella sp. Scap07 TaxID=2589987 RepID=UPI0015B87BA7|nr:hypothetical protein [Shewanella sp. Scap07]QLE86648.1 hypothetical protein FLM48_17155 [Shewanella sp. Scap07]